MCTLYLLFQNFSHFLVLLNRQHKLLYLLLFISFNNVFIVILNKVGLKRLPWTRPLLQHEYDLIIFI